MSKVKSDYRLDIMFDNISKIQYFETIDNNEQGVVEAVYDGASDEDRQQNQLNVDTTLLIYLKRPATFFLTKTKVSKKILSPFALP